jgi:hypothetical protein
MSLTLKPPVAAWRNKREPKMIRSEPPHKDSLNLWEPLFTIGDAMKLAQRQPSQRPISSL